MVKTNLETSIHLAKLHIHVALCSLKNGTRRGNKIDKVKSKITSVALAASVSRSQSWNGINKCNTLIGFRKCLRAYSHSDPAFVVAC